MIAKTMIMPQRQRRLAPPFAWIDRRFLFDGFLAALSSQENLLYFFLVLVADCNGVSFYSYDKICTLLRLDVDAYIQARDGLMRQQLIAFDGQRFQVLALPETASAWRKPRRIANIQRGKPAHTEVACHHFGTQALSEIFAHLASSPEKRMNQKPRP